MFGLILGLLFAIFGGSLEILLLYLAGMLLPLVFLFPLFAFHMLGAGDIKLFSIIGLFIGPKHILTVMLLSALFGSIQAIYVLLKNKNIRERLHYFFDFFTKREHKLSKCYYCKSEDSYKNAIHFSLSIFSALVVYVAT